MKSKWPNYVQTIFSFLINFYILCSNNLTIKLYACEWRNDYIFKSFYHFKSRNILICTFGIYAHMYVRIELKSAISTTLIKGD